MDASITVLIASAISAIVAMAVVALQYSLERRRQSQAERADRMGSFLSASFAAGKGIEELAVAASKSKVQAEVDMRSAVQNRLNDSLTRLRLFEDAEVVAAATHLERELTRLVRVARSQVWTREAWRRQREGLSSSTHKYETIARARLGRNNLHQELDFYTELGIYDLPPVQCPLPLA